MVVLTAHTDAQNARSGDFRADDNDNDDRQTDRLLYPLCMRTGLFNISTPNFELDFLLNSILELHIIIIIKVWEKIMHCLG